MSARPSDYMRMLVLRLLVLAIAVTAVFLLLTSAGAGELPVPTVEHTVASGESLWQIVGEAAPEGSDLRRVVADVMDLNGLEDATIHPGQTLQLPTH